MWGKESNSISQFGFLVNFFSRHIQKKNIINIFFKMHLKQKHDK